MSYVLDTNAAIAIINGRPPQVRERLRLALASRRIVTIPAMVLFELRYGVAKSSRRSENAERLRAFLSGSLSVVPFEEEDAILAGDLRAELEASGTPIGPYDLLIAAQARRLRATVVTANVAEFARVPELAVEDWTDT